MARVWIPCKNLGSGRFKRVYQLQIPGLDIKGALRNYELCPLWRQVKLQPGVHAHGPHAQAVHNQRSISRTNLLLQS